MYTGETTSTRKCTGRTVEIIDRTYKKSDLEDAVTDASKLDHQQEEMPLGILRHFKDLFDEFL